MFIYWFKVDKALSAWENNLLETRAGWRYARHVCCSSGRGD